ncbi:hypothetical protein [Streptomyces malaysiensis]|uniref:hypothetical protein n=1 Tax=Streptomyces malaysiensis TaxID=92644 RepID=UPI002279E216|nr:hypothetical protein [Streptomyces sp. SPMA113]
MFEAGGTATPEGAAALAALDTELRERNIAPRGSAALLAGPCSWMVCRHWRASRRPGGESVRPGASGSQSVAGAVSPWRWRKASTSRSVKSWPTGSPVTSTR